MADEFQRAGALLISDLLVQLDDAARSIMRQADFLIPKDTETARESARIFPPTEDPSPGITFGFGYGGAVNPKTGQTPDMYVVPLHELVEVKHAPPTQAKFLEEPLFDWAAREQSQLGAELRLTFARRLPTLGSQIPAFGGGFLVRGARGRFTGVRF